MDPNWFPSPNRVVVPGIGEQFVAGSLAVGLGALLLPQRTLRNAIALPAMVWIAYAVKRYSSGPAEEDYLATINIALTIAKFVDFSVMHDPEKEYRRIRADGSVETAEEIANMTLWQKLCWNLDLFTTARGICWNWQVKNSGTVPQNISRSKFVLDQLWTIAGCFICIDLHEWYMVHRSPFGGPGPLPHLFDLPLYEQVFCSLFHAFYTYSNLSIMYCLAAAIVVGTGLSRPQRWPSPFGTFTKDAYTLRNCWGKCWHQFLRRVFETSNAALVSVLRVKKGTFVSRYLQLYNAFFVSAVIHHIGAMNVPYKPSVKYQFFWFVIQAVAISFEDFVIYLGKKAGISKSWKTKALGFAWVAGFLSWGLRYPVALLFDYGGATVRHPIVSRLSIMDRIVGK